MQPSPPRFTIIHTVLLLVLLTGGFLPGAGSGRYSNAASAQATEESMHDDSQTTGQTTGQTTDAGGAATAPYREAVFAGGCFWCMEPPYDKLDGVIETVSGYAGGHTENPGYYDVVDGGTGHAEVVKVVYDPAIISYSGLLKVFWKNIDPTTADRQFCDVGDQYRAAIFYANDDEKHQAEASLADIIANAKLPGSVVTRIEPLHAFYPAEDYHQDYYRKNPLRYRMYRAGCGRDARLRQLWGKD